MRDLDRYRNLKELIGSPEEQATMARIVAERREFVALELHAACPDVMLDKGNLKVVLEALRTMVPAEDILRMPEARLLWEAGAKYVEQHVEWERSYKTHYTISWIEDEARGVWETLERTFNRFCVVLTPMHPDRDLVTTPLTPDEARQYLTRLGWSAEDVEFYTEEFDW